MRTWKETFEVRRKEKVQDLTRQLSLGSSGDLCTKCRHHALTHVRQPLHGTGNRSSFWRNSMPDRHNTLLKRLIVLDPYEAFNHGWKPRPEDILGFNTPIPPRLFLPEPEDFFETTSYKISYADASSDDLYDWSTQVQQDPKFAPHALLSSTVCADVLARPLTTSFGFRARKKMENFRRIELMFYRDALVHIQDTTFHSACVNAGSECLWQWNSEPPCIEIHPADDKDGNLCFSTETFFFLTDTPPVHIKALISVLLRETAAMVNHSES